MLWGLHSPFLSWFLFSSEIVSTLPNAAMVKKKKQKEKEGVAIGGGHRGRATKAEETTTRPVKPKPSTRYDTRGDSVATSRFIFELVLQASHPRTEFVVVYVAMPH